MSDLSKRLARMTPAQFAEVKRRLGEKSRGRAGAQPIPRRAARFAARAPLSFAQERLWFLHRLDPASYAFNISNAVRLRGRLDVEALGRTLDEIIRRHEALRTTFGDDGGEPCQLIAPSLRLELREIDLRHLPRGEREAEAERRITAEARRPFDLTRGPVLRPFLLRLADDEHVALLTMHHIVSDGWSMGVLVREVAALYAAYSAGAPSPLPELPLQYADFTTWQRERLRGEHLEGLLAYWKRQLGGRLPVLELPTDRPRGAAFTFKGGAQAFDLPRAVAEPLAALGRQEGATMFMTLLAAIQVLLQRYTGLDDIPVGVNIANRDRRDIEGLIGFFINNLVLRGDLSGDPTFRELLRRTREVTLGAYAHQELPFETLVEALQPGRRHNAPLFQVMFVMQNAPVPPLELPGLTLEPYRLADEQSAFDLTFFAREDGGGGVVGWLEYNSELFNASTVGRMLENLRRLLAEIARNPDRRVGDFSADAAGEGRQLIHAFNDALE